MTSTSRMFSRVLFVLLLNCVHDRNNRGMTKGRKECREKMREGKVGEGIGHVFSLDLIPSLYLSL